MSQPRAWFRQGELQKTFKIGNTIELTKPELSSKWAIIAITEEDDHPTYESDGVPAFTTAKLTREASDSSKRAFIRVFVQISCVGTEFEDAETRGRQATRFKPQELTALKKLSKI